ncbi:Retrovirus-related Pol polyprotein from transposon opus [Vitis vinifera]|uniref:RNA-directed DNA polymerase n=1 Tax=Vitis vinifera TaxID=29760 RepID=A0A438DC46_VITVI|nr:Retrovirus-related Pol polyprotein from transposon opus [Vitis vinifera]
MKSQPSVFNAKAGMYTLNEDDDMKAKFVAMTRRFGGARTEKMHEVQAVVETPMQVKLCPICQSYEHLMEECPTIPTVKEMFGDQANAVGQFRPNNNAPYGNTYNSSWRNHPNFSWKAGAPQYQQLAQPSQQSSSLEQAIVNLSKVVGDFVGDQKSINSQLSQRVDLLNKKMDGIQNDLSQKIDNLQYSISRLTNLNTVQEKGRFPSQPHQNPKGIHEVETHEGESSQVRDVKALITLWSVPKGPVYYQKRVECEQETFLTEQVSALIQCKSPLKYKDLGCPTISVMIGGKVVEKGLLDLGASVNLLPYSVYKQLGLGQLKPTSITLSLADRLVKIPRGVIEDVLVQVDNFYYPVDFVVLDTDPTIKEANSVPIILGRPFLATSNAIINCRNGLMQLTFGNMTLELNIFHMSKKQITPEEEEGPEEVGGGEKRFYLCLIKRKEKLTEEETPKLNLKLLLVELKYTYLEENNQCPVVISSSLTSHKRFLYLKFSRGIIYPIFDSPWVSLTQVVPKKSGITVVQNEKREEIATRLTSGEDHFHMSIWNIRLQKNAFGLCNAPATFQRCMLSIFNDMVERIMEVFMDDITIMEELSLAISSPEKGIEVDKAKVELIAKLSSPTIVKGVRQFLGHAGFYRRFIQDFSKLSRPLCELLAKDANDFAIGAVLGQREYGKPYMIYYASKTLNKAQRNYTTIEKELLVVVFALDKFRAYLIRDKKRVENVVADHLSRRKLLGMLILLTIWLLVKFQVSGKRKTGSTFFGKIHAYYWEEPFLFKYCADQIIRKCVPGRIATRDPQPLP